MAVVAVPLGVISAVKQNSPTDFVVRLIAMVGLSVPNFWLAAMLLLVTGVVWAVKDQPWIDLPALAVAVLVTHLGLLFWETRYVSANLAYPSHKPKETPP